MMRVTRSLSVALFFALLCSVSSVSHIEARKNREDCSASCGNITDIRYPFRLPTSPAGCGESDYQLTCENNRTTVFNFSGARYLVKNISYDNHLIRLVDENLADRRCRLPSRSFTQTESLSDSRFGIFLDYSYVAFVRCPANNVTDRGYERVDCLSVNSTTVFVNYTDDSYAPAPPSCRVIRRVSTLPNAVNGSYDYETVAALMADGFDMGWSVECRDCIRGGGDCRFDPDRPYKFTRCNDERENYKREVRIAILVLVAIIVGGILFLVAVGVLIYRCCCVKRRRSSAAAAAKPTENLQTENGNQPSSP